MDLLLLILISFGSACLVMCFIPKSQWDKQKPNRRRLRSSSKPAKTLPWFDKDYLERKRKQKEDIFI